MKKFDELQIEHQKLLAETSTPGDPEKSLQSVRDYIDKVCSEAERVPSPRDRDQLRANLRFWASYVYDRTGVYPDTTLRPATSVSTSSASRIPHPFWSIVVGVTVILVLTLIFGGLWNSIRAGQSQVFPGVVTVEPGSSVGNGPLTLDTEVLTSGPSPTDSNVWVVKIKIKVGGGDGNYVYWVNDQHLPIESSGEFIVNGTGCQSERLTVGVTSGGSAESQLLIVKSPLLSCP